MKKNLKKVVLVLALLLPGVIKAQEFNVTAKADFVSDYIWRGAYQNSGFSVQPTLGLSYGNLSLSAWGSQSLTKTDGAQEFDINLSYTIGGLGITVTDYWWNGITMPYGDYKHDHHFEGTLAYNFGENFPLTLSWSTMFAGGDDNKDGDRAYSTYINASYNIACPAEITNHVMGKASGQLIRCCRLRRIRLSMVPMCSGMREIAALWAVRMFI